MYIQYIQGVGQFTHSTADDALLLVAPATTALSSESRETNDHILLSQTRQSRNLKG
jgi:hypothetical protein